MSIEEVSFYFLGGDPIPFFGLVPIDPRSSWQFKFDALWSILLSVPEPVAEKIVCV